jgi:hypothetical protein
MSPAATGAPEASATPMQSGNATKKTTIDERKSCFQCRKGELDWGSFMGL